VFENRLAQRATKNAAADKLQLMWTLRIVQKPWRNHKLGTAANAVAQAESLQLLLRGLTFYPSGSLLIWIFSVAAVAFTQSVPPSTKDGSPDRRRAYPDRRFQEPEAGHVPAT
jgi:hypothetical protein